MQIAIALLSTYSSSMDMNIINLLWCGMDYIQRLIHKGDCYIFFTKFIQFLNLASKCVVCLLWMFY